MRIVNGLLVSHLVVHLVMSLLTTNLPDFRQRVADQPEHWGDTAANAKQYDEAISLYTTALSHDPPSPQDILIKRSKVYMALGSWQQAADDANQVRHHCRMQVNLVDASSGDRA